MAEAPVSLQDLIRGPVAAAVLRALMRDAESQMRTNGAAVPVWALPVYRALQEASEAPIGRPALVAVIGHRSVKLTASSWVSVTEASTQTGLSERHVRRLAQTGAVIARRIGRRPWAIDLESLENTLRRRQAA